MQQRIIGDDGDAGVGWVVGSGAVQRGLEIRKEHSEQAGGYVIMTKIGLC